MTKLLKTQGLKILKITKTNYDNIGELSTSIKLINILYSRVGRTCPSFALIWYHIIYKNTSLAIAFVDNVYKH